MEVATLREGLDIFIEALICLNMRLVCLEQQWNVSAAVVGMPLMLPAVMSDASSS